MAKIVCQVLFCENFVEVDQQNVSDVKFTCREHTPKPRFDKQYAQQTATIRIIRRLQNV
jgi:hypothetical protein